ncbi:MAG: hypothetical protein IJL38_00265, partial [Bacteroidales bacterium]|nr:hypothetical protein [Bacteroidales bacterium]
NSDIHRLTTKNSLLVISDNKKQSKKNNPSTNIRRKTKTVNHFQKNTECNRNKHKEEESGQWLWICG